MIYLAADEWEANQTAVSVLGLPRGLRNKIELVPIGYGYPKSAGWDVYYDSPEPVFKIFKRSDSLASIKVYEA